MAQMYNYVSLTNDASQLSGVSAVLLSDQDACEIDNVFANSKDATMVLSSTGYQVDFVNMLIGDKPLLRLVQSPRPVRYEFQFFDGIRWAPFDQDHQINLNICLSAGRSGMTLHNHVPALAAASYSVCFARGTQMNIITGTVRAIRIKEAPFAPPVVTPYPSTLAAVTISKALNSSFEQHVLCPITQAVMREPVVASDGHTYERSALMRWMETNDTSPMTNEKITNLIVPNYNLRAIMNFVESSTRVSFDEDTTMVLGPATCKVVT